MRSSFQHGSVIQVHRKSGDVWKFRYRDGQAQRSDLIGTLQQYPTKASAEKAASIMVPLINGPRSECITIADLIARFEREAMPERPATAHSYKSILKRVNSDWGETRIDKFAADALQVENWLKELVVIGRHPRPGKPRQVSPMYRGQVRAVLHLLFEKAQLWKVSAIQRNPISLIKIKDSSKRKKELSILNLAQYQALLADPELPLLIKTLMQVCTGLGLRISEALGLKWSDLDFETGTVQIQRAASSGQVGDTKTSSSAAKLPLHPEIIAMLQMWRMTEPVVKGWVFGSERTGMPYNRDYLRDEYLIPAGRAGIGILGGIQCGTPIVLFSARASGS